MTTFIKAEEQNHSLFNYVHTLETEFEQLSEANENLTQAIARVEERAELTKEEKLNLELSLKDEVVMLQDEISQK